MSTMRSSFRRLEEHRFLFEELVKRDFKIKYKRTVLGVGWSLLAPLLTLLIMKLVFSQFFGRSTPHYTIFIFCGNVVWSYFSEATHGGMRALIGNAGIITKVNVPKYLFVLSRNIQALLGFLLTLVVLFLFVLLDTLPFTWNILMLIYPIVLLVFFNIGVGMVLSAMYVFFRDIEYLYDIFLRLLLYVSAIFYSVDSFPPHIQRLFLINPIYLFIKYFRCVIIDGNLPSLAFHLLLLGDTALMFLLGCVIYKKNNNKFLYYL